MHKHFIIAIFLAGLCVSCIRDVTADARYNRERLSKGSVVVLNRPCSLVQYPALRDLVPVEPTDLSSWEKKEKVSVIASGTRVRFLGVREMNVYMAPTAEVTTYGKIMDGEFKGTKVRIDGLLKEKRSYSITNK
jgi:hypothetical protein